MNKHVVKTRKHTDTRSINFRITLRDYDVLLQIAREQNLTITGLVRELMTGIARTGHLPAQVVEKTIEVPVPIPDEYIEAKETLDAARVLHSASQVVNGTKGRVLREAVTTLLFDEDQES